MSNDPIREWILSEGKAMQITRISPIGGGCINLASRYDTDAGSYFVKTNRYKTCRLSFCSRPLLQTLTILVFVMSYTVRCKCFPIKSSDPVLY